MSNMVIATGGSSLVWEIGFGGEETSLEISDNEVSIKANPLNKLSLSDAGLVKPKQGEKPKAEEKAAVTDALKSSAVDSIVVGEVARTRVKRFLP